MEDRDQRFADELLDAALRRYASIEAQPGLEGRVLAGVRGRQASNRRRTAWAWAGGLAAAAAIVIVLVVTLPRQRRVPSVGAAVTQLAPIVSSRVTDVDAQPAHKQTRTWRSRLSKGRLTGLHNNPALAGAASTRPAQFPTPRPLSEQEKLLLAYAQALRGSGATSTPRADQNPEGELKIPKLSITAIEILPLSPSENGREE